MNNSVFSTPAVLSFFALSSRQYLHILLLCLFPLIPGCSSKVDVPGLPAVAERSGYSLPGGTQTDDGEARWWLTFDDPVLHELIETALPANFSLQQAAARLRQAVMLQKKAEAEVLPPIEANYGYSAEKESGSSRSSNSVVDLSVSWEADVWGRLDHKNKASAYLAEAAADDFRNIALLISFEIAETYFGLVEQRLERKLLEKQIGINNTYLKLTELRFANGAASVVDVYQQRQLLTGREADLLLVDERIVALQNRLQVLAGRIPGAGFITTSETLPQLPELPALGIPADLLQNRPDLRSLQAQLSASHHQIAAAVADRLPRVRIGGSMGFNDGTFFQSLFVDAFSALIDWQQRKSEVDRERAIAEERANFFAQAYLVAVEEVENSLWREKYHMSLLKTLNRQLELARATLRESRNRYMQGLSDYLPVLGALQASQNLEREYLQRRLERVNNRLILNRALGGSVIELDQSSSQYGGHQQALTQDLTQ